MLHYAFLTYQDSPFAYGGSYCHANLTATAHDQYATEDGGWTGDVEVSWGVSSSGGSVPHWYAEGWRGIDWFEDDGQDTWLKLVTSLRVA